MATRRANSPDDASSGAAGRKRDSTHVTWSAPDAEPSRSRQAADSGKGRSQPVTPAPRPARVSPGSIANSIASPPPRRATGGNAELVITGLLAAAYLLTAVAWLITALRSPVQIADVVGNLMFITGLWIAVAAGPVWFVGIMMLGREFSFGRRAILYVVGILALIPWPYISWAAA